MGCCIAIAVIVFVLIFCQRLDFKVCLSVVFFFVFGMDVILVVGTLVVLRVVLVKLFPLPPRLLFSYSFFNHIRCTFVVIRCLTKCLNI